MEPQQRSLAGTPARSFGPRPNQLLKHQYMHMHTCVRPSHGAVVVGEWLGILFDGHRSVQFPCLNDGSELVGIELWLCRPKLKCCRLAELDLGNDLLERPRE